MTAKQHGLKKYIVRVLLQRSLATAASLHKRLSRVRSRGDLEQTCDEATLSPDVVSTDISNLPLSDHRHRLKTRQCSSGRPEPAKPEPRTSQSLNTPVILLENVVEVFNLAQRDRRHSSASFFISATAFG